MDVVEFRRLTARVVATRNAESRAFLQAFDLAPGALSGWSSGRARGGRPGAARTTRCEAPPPSWRCSSASRLRRFAKPGG